MKKILSFSAPINKEFTPTKKDFREVDGGYEVDQVIFSTAYNRNGYFFQVSKLMAYADKLSKLGTNFNHDLRLTNNQYIPAQQAGYTRIWAEWLNGELEIRGTFKFSDQRVVDVMDQINAPSIELLVDETNAIINENGEYYESFEWVGTAQLLGVLAGSGDARNLSEFREFDLNLNPIITMTEEQVKQLLDEQKKDFDAQLELVKKDFEIIAQSKSESAGEYTYTDENGNVYKTTHKDMYTSVTELIEKGSMSSDSMLYKMLESKGIKFSTETVEPTETVEEAPEVETTEEVVETVEETPTEEPTEEVKVEEPTQEETPVVDEAAETLKTVENALQTSIENKSKVFASVQSSESLVEQVAATGDVKENAIDYRDAVREKLSHINL